MVWNLKNCTLSILIKSDWSFQLNTPFEVRDVVATLAHYLLPFAFAAWRVHNKYWNRWCLPCKWMFYIVNVTLALVGGAAALSNATGQRHSARDTVSGEGFKVSHSSKRHVSSCMFINKKGDGYSEGKRAKMIVGEGHKGDEQREKLSLWSTQPVQASKT